MTAAAESSRIDLKPLKGPAIILGIAALLPLLDTVLPAGFKVSDSLRPIFIYAILGLGLNIVTGYTGLLNLGVAAFMAIGTYSYAILTCDIYPFQLGFWLAVPAAAAIGFIVGIVLGLPTIRLRGDYLAIVTLGFGEIIQDSIRNLEAITKGTQGINPLPGPTLFGYQFSGGGDLPWYYLFLGILALVCLLCSNLERSRLGRAWISLREDELASRCMGINPVKYKLLAFAVGASLCSISGALWAGYLGSSGEPGNYDFQVSMLALCIVIVGGAGNISGVLIGALVMVGFNSLILVKISDAMMRNGLISTTSVFTAPNNYKYMVFGLALVLRMRYRPGGLLPAGSTQNSRRHR